jgi:hypoxanthine phosphoribosyltransferase
MQIHLDDDTYKKMVHSIAYELSKNLGDDLLNSCIIGIGESGIDTAQIIYEFYNQKCKIKKCDVDKKTRTVQGLSLEDIHNKNIIICDSIINTGTTVEILREYLIEKKPKSIKILTVVLRNESPLIPNYYALMIEKNDDIFYNIENYPIYKYHFGLIRKIKNDDANKHFKCGDPQIDKWCIEDYLHCSIYSQLYSTYIFEVDNEILGILHFFEQNDDKIYVNIIGVAENKHEMKIGSSLMSFLFKYCKFNKKQYITLSAFEDTSIFYEKLGFKPRKNIDLPNLGRLIEMEYKVY